MLGSDSLKAFTSLLHVASEAVKAGRQFIKRSCLPTIIETGAQPRKTEEKKLWSCLRDGSRSTPPCMTAQFSESRVHIGLSTHVCVVYQ